MDIKEDPKIAFYFFAFAVLGILSLFIIKNAMVKKDKVKNSTNPEIVRITAQSQSDDIQSIEKDVDTTDLDELDKIDSELDAIEAELDASI